jgi:fatty-acyl-CoA synthase
MVKPINSGGESIFPDEVEAVLRYHPDISNAAVVGIPDRLMGEILVAVVEPVAGRPVPTVEEFTEFCTGRMAGYRVPRAILPVERVVLTAAGKPDYDWAREVARARLVDQGVSGAQ